MAIWITVIISRGLSNNPSVEQLKCIFTRLVTICGVKVEANGNVRSMNDTALLQASTTYVSLPVGSEDYVEDVIDRKIYFPKEH